MLKLHGAPGSNYYNMVKLSLLEKRLPFAEVLRMPSQDADYLQVSPMGKIPALETESGFISETHAMLDYLEDAYPPPVPRFAPADPFQRAKLRELTQSIELYIELVARRGYGVLFGRPTPDEVKAVLKTELAKGAIAVKRLLKLEPWALGRDISYADFVLYYTLVLANVSAQAHAGLDLVAEFGAGAWQTRMAARDSVRRCTADAAAFRAAMAANR